MNLAQKMRLTATHVYLVKNSHEYSQIVAKIEQSALIGEFSLLYGWVGAPAATLLLLEGFKIGQTMKGDEPNTHISWYQDY